ncbi:HlyD family type I secretion periplasmic adaptor subunit [Sphaerotilus microaerophilus]|uniref:Membrane fusion protein (MFP) family protein n=1 Tax=Sphaerotilus microaerophilus TaxID=2914710 RepID=A0ABM7YNS5_9BURK|nr:HlyD family type I secretion periplasmic adaptor subunit [Sphaerotilus sp. FB-5]BDI06141.1 HlyD family type I secretion periplasmic adaptor subunit [Sphaerotilus sp. FB-5]
MAESNSTALPASAAMEASLWQRLRQRLVSAGQPARSAPGPSGPAGAGAKGSSGTVKAGTGLSLKRRGPATVGIPLGVARVPASEAIPGSEAVASAEPPLLTDALPTRSTRQAPARAVVRHSPGRFVRGDEQLLEGVRAAIVQEASPHALWALYLLCLTVIAAVVWAVYAKVDIVTRAEGRIVPEAREQVIASLEPGILRALHVREGAVVQAGEELAQLDPTRVSAQQNEGLAKQTALRATSARLLAEVAGRPLSFPPEVRIDAAVVAAETEAYEARQQALREGIELTRRSMALLDNELSTAQHMAEQGLMSEVEVMRLRRQRNELQMQMQERRNRFRQEASTELLKVRTELAQLGEQQVVRDDALKRTVLKSPLRGIVKNIRINTIGGVVTAGAPIMEIVPLSDKILVEARIRPADIGFVRVGQPAEVKLTSYDYFIYGGLKGTIDYISPDALGEDSRMGAADTSYYRARIRTDVSMLRAKDNQPLPVLPGMTAAVEIRTGDRSVMQFLLKPMLKGSEAMRER